MQKKDAEIASVLGRNAKLEEAVKQLSGQEQAACNTPCVSQLIYSDIVADYGVLFATAKMALGFG